MREAESDGEVRKRIAALENGEIDVTEKLILLETFFDIRADHLEEMYRECSITVRALKNMRDYFGLV